MAKNAKRPARKAPIKKPAARVKRPATVRLSAAVERDLLAAAEQYAVAHRTTVAQLVCEGLRKVTGFAKAPVLPPGDLEVPSSSDGGPWNQLMVWMEEQQATLTEIRDALGDVAASLPHDPRPGDNRPTPGPRIPPL